MGISGDPSLGTLQMTGMHYPWYRQVMCFFFERTVLSQLHVSWLVQIYVHIVSNLLEPLP